MKFNTQGLALVIVFQLFIVGATLSITATNAGAVGLPCAIPENASDEVVIGYWVSGNSLPANTTLFSDDYLTTGEVDEADYRNVGTNVKTILSFVKYLERG